MHAILATLALLAGPGSADETVYWFGSSPNRTNITFETRTNLGGMAGQTNQIRGSAAVDFAGGAGKVHLTVPVESLNTGIAGRDTIMRSETYLDAAKFPSLEFKGEKASKGADNVWKIEGEFSMHGIPKPLTVDAEVIAVPDKVSRKFFGEGSWVKVNVTFKIMLSSHGVKVDPKYGANMDDTWTVKMELYGTTAKPKDAPAAVSGEPKENLKVEAPVLEGDHGKRHRFGIKPQLANMSATSKTEIETVIAHSTAIGGVVAVDAEKGSGKVKIRVPVASLRTGIDVRDEHLRSAYWLDVEKFPNIEFESTKASKKDDKSWTVEGQFTMHGQSKPVTAEVELTEIPAEIVRQQRWGLKPAIRFRATFKIKLSDFGVKMPEQAVGKVQDEWTVSFDATAISE